MQKFLNKNQYYFPIWLFLRIITSLDAALFSNIRPITVTENQVSVWPPLFDNISLWFNRVALAPWFRWDAVWYVQLLTTGYVAWDGSTSFHPLYIILSKPLYIIGVNPLLSLLVTSSLACLAFFWIFYQLACIDLSQNKSLLALALLASFPITIILFAPYTESVFLFFSTCALYKIRHRRWLSAALLTLLATLTRQQGVFLLFPMLWCAWEDFKESNNWKGWLAAITAPAGLFIWTIYRIIYLHEGTLDVKNWQGFIYSALLSPSAKVIFPDQALKWPWDAFMIALPKLNNPDIGDVMSVGLGVYFFILFLLSWCNMHPAYRIYSLVIILISFSMSTGSFRIYLSLPRHLFLAIPVFIGISPLLNKKWQQFLMIGFQFSIQLFMLFIYVTKSWIP